VEARLVLRQSANDPPKLFAVGGEKTALVLDPNPWLSERKLGRVETVTWSSKDGRAWRGGLYYPPDYEPGRRYPVLLQTHGYNENQFSLTGYSLNFGAQPVAAFGIVVLQIAENTADLDGAAQWPAVQGGYESAIDYLDTRGLIDRTRVGMVGWSWSGPAVGYMLTHSDYPIAAAEFTDSADFGWWYYLLGGAQVGEHEYGPAPIGSGLDIWRSMSPSFNLDRVRTPMLMWTGGAVEDLWDWYSLLRRQGKPVEYWNLPDGTHEAFKIGERLHTNQLLVDWFRFWLKGDEDAAPNKAEQYRRWEGLCTKQRATSPENPTACLMGAPPS
jgi:dipeptidyl aminopeptidase/acylaminoacyl peptidase